MPVDATGRNRSKPCNPSECHRRPSLSAAMAGVDPLTLETSLSAASHVGALCILLIRSKSIVFAAWGVARDDTTAVHTRYAITLGRSESREGHVVLSSLLSACCMHSDLAASYPDVGSKVVRRRLLAQAACLERRLPLVTSLRALVAGANLVHHSQTKTSRA